MRAMTSTHAAKAVAIAATALRKARIISIAVTPFEAPPAFGHARYARTNLIVVLDRFG